MKYRLRVANLSRGMDLEGVLSNLNELERVYYESQPYLGKVTEEKKISITKTINYCRGLVDVNIDLKRDHDENRLTEGFLRIA